MKLALENIFNTIIFTLVILVIGTEFETSHANSIVNKSGKKAETIKGQSGGSIDSKGCGFIAASPNYTMNLVQRIDYMRLTVETAGGQPTLLVLGPNPGDSFCVLGDEVSGLKPEISGVWEAGLYEIYIGDRIGQNYQFTLNISTEN